MDLEENQTPKEGTSSGNEENTYITFSEDIVQLVNSGGQVCLNIIFSSVFFYLTLFPVLLDSRSSLSK